MIEQDASGGTLLVVLDKYALHLAFGSGAGGKPLSKNTAASYFGNVRNYYLDRFEPLRLQYKRILLKIASTLENHLQNRADNFVHKAPACTNADLVALTTCLLKHASNVRDYSDAALIAVFWVLFGCSSNAACLRKSQLAVFPGALDNCCQIVNNVSNCIIFDRRGPFCQLQAQEHCKRARCRDSEGQTKLRRVCCSRSGARSDDADDAKPKAARSSTRGNSSRCRLRL